jgi:glutaconate CoA-transferase, subunit A
VDAVVVEPKACHPSYAQGYYDRDNRFYLDWEAISRDPATLAAWLKEWVFDLESHAEYVTKLGEDRWAVLSPEESWSDPVNYGTYA